jgi:7-cyano-7-deazaguanine synthase
MKKAVILLSGGLDSTTTLAIAKDSGYECYGLSFDYGQKQKSELVAATRVAKKMAVQHKIINIGIGDFGGSALTDEAISVPHFDATNQEIPVTYVPARNTIFLSFALGYAEVLESSDIFIGVNAVDYSGYPDCRPEYIKAYETMANLATKSAVCGNKITIHTPLITLDKSEIIAKGLALGVDYSQTITCYNANEKGLACGKCDACEYRRLGFEKLGQLDPTKYF